VVVRPMVGDDDVGAGGSELSRLLLIKRIGCGQ